MALTNYWDKHPPLALMVQCYLGIEPKTKPAAQQAPDLMRLLSESFPKGAP